MSYCQFSPIPPPELENLACGWKNLIHHVWDTTTYKVITGFA